MSTDKLCAFCNKGPRVPAYAPFCSPGCQDRDLLQWMRGGYALPSSDNEDELSDNVPLDNRGLDG
ncbi:MAG: DNA gyrase inhibitor YacG [Polymorphobacter sp.]